MDIDHVTAEIHIVLRSIDATLKELLALSKSKRAAAKPTDDQKLHVDLDGPYGDPLIKAKDPKDWAGPSMRDRHFSECPPAYLFLLAQRYDYFASRELDEKKKRYNQLDAEKARHWAQRIESGYKPKTQNEATMPPVSEDEIKW
jgi:hypothetical protein